MGFPILAEDRQDRPVTFADAGEDESFSGSVKAAIGNVIPIAKTAVVKPLEVARTVVMAPLDPLIHPRPYRDIFMSSEKAQRLVGNIASENVATEEAYDRRIAAVKAATGTELENPLRGGYAIDARKRIREEVRAGGMQGLDEKGGVPSYQRRIFDERLEELRQNNLDKATDLTFGDIGAEAMALAKGATEEQAKAAAADVNPIASFGFGFAGGMWGQRRDPVFVGSMFAGPTSAVGKTALARVASSALFQGLFNAGLTAIEQPDVQDWRARVGVESGVVPALEEVGMSFLFGLIPGAAFRGVHELGQREIGARLKRTLDGNPEPGDIEALSTHLGVKLAPEETATIKAAMESLDADRAVLPPRPQEVSPQLHDDLTAAALKHAEDPINEPAPAGVAFIEAYHGSPHDFDRFDISRIGTGEGVQSYGHGLYLAENADVAVTYQATLPISTNVRDAHFARFDSRAPKHLTAEDRAFAQQVIEERMGLYSTDSLAKVADYLKNESTHKFSHFNEIRSVLASMDEQPGNLYRTRIHADREHFLNWDKPLSEQPENVRAAAQKAWTEAAMDGKVPDTHTGQNLVNDLQRVGKDEASRILNDAGLPGIKYLDQGSRAIDAPDHLLSRLEDIGARLDEIKSLPDQTKAIHAEFDALTAERQGLNEELRQYREQAATRNFVVFDDKLIEIVDKNGVPIPKPEPLNPEVIARVEAAQPETIRDAQMAATEALEGIGTRETIAQTRGVLDTPVYEPPPVVETPMPTGRARGDILDKVPHARDDGSPITVTPATLAKAGEKESTFAMLVRSCK